MLKAVVLDFDGVVLQSVDVKTKAFAELFAGEAPQARRRIVDYHLANGGISRFEKFRWAYREVLRRELPADEEASLGRRFNELVEEGVVAAEWVPGAREFLDFAQGRVPLYVASGTPEDELRRIVERRGLASRFAGVFGSPSKKAEILRRAAASSGSAPGELAMVGDAINDYDAARAAGSAFVGVVEPGRESPFPKDVVVLPDLRGLAKALGLA
ncbi:MAG: HAD family hydrolase [Elusimicrobia bacterium]|nr:HAD family hydrolase [Elusimicrobiota bacterium]